MKSFSSWFSRGLLALLLLTLRLPVAAQAPAWQSARVVAAATATAAGNFSEVRATAVDAAGNVFLAGTFRNTVLLGGTTLTSLGIYDVFVAKFSPVSNQFVWAQRAGSSGSDQVRALVVSGTSIYVAGSFGSSTADFGPAMLTNMGTNNIFVAKLTDAGNTGSFVWAQRAGGAGADLAYALAVNGTNVYVAGVFQSPMADFGATTLTNAGSGDVFVAKLSDAGNTGSFVWAQRAGSTDYEYATALVVSGTNVYVAGSFLGRTVGFGNTTLTNTGNYDVFVAKLSDAGNTGSFAWAQWAGGTGADLAYTLAVSGSSVYVAGEFRSSTAGFGPITLTNVDLNNTADVFVAKLSDAGSMGSFAWAQRAGGSGLDQARALIVSGTSVYVAGDFSSLTASFGSSILTNAGSTGTTDVFVAKLSDAGSTGSFAWVQRAGGTDSDFAWALVVSATSVHVAGDFTSSTAIFGTTTIPNPNSDALGFLASLTDATLTATAAGRPLALAQLFPNPAHHAATRRLPTGTAPVSLILTDALGRTVRRYPAPAGAEAALDLRGLPAGLYLLRGVGSAQRLVVE